MRNALGLLLATVVAALAITGVWYWVSKPSAAKAAAQSAQAKPSEIAPPPPARVAAKASSKDEVEYTGTVQARPAAAPQAPVLPKSTCANPDALGISRTVVVDTSGGPGFGLDHFKQFDFLADREVVLTFDDGPWPVNTPAVLKALADECTTGIFFSIGKHATYHPEILRQVLAAGHVVGVHTWSHANLNGKKMTDETAKEELEKGFSAVKFALGTNPAPFFRFPQLQHRPSAVAYLGNRNIAMFSCDVDSFDFRSKDADQVVNTVMTGLDKKGKGIILMHDFQKNTALALPTLLRRLKAGGYKVVAMRPKGTLDTLPEYDAMIGQDPKLPTTMTNARPISSVIQTISQ
ncbi:polysaccharide deacetylase domain-containing protein [Bradyrhizobium oligotrophicum S58]|uniref:Chitooligosaccharide deacetylase n=1 Tax=Bradyrhizobium oligotrophicum S58 TaxID=1245469 RepID=M4ZJ59_9BRAD|nr:polysaccharide deacetylase family protein [Bradyrhizobium oligotrophicum]BAM86315.1 polysaccharide deacetylase domain-containing protein [Bradyrhizobium oligotrophicum S58]